MEKAKKIKIPRYKKIIAIVISAFMAIIPFISYLKIMILDNSIKDIFGDSNGIYIDLFLYYKKIL